MSRLRPLVPVVVVLVCAAFAGLVLIACQGGVRGPRFPSAPAVGAAPSGYAGSHGPAGAHAMFASRGGDPELASLLASPVLSPEEELWVIERSPDAAAPTDRDDDLPRTGSLVCGVSGAPRPVPVPLEHTDVRAAIAGFIATTDVTQRFHNPFDTKIEAVYVFPLPETAAVSEFVMTVGERRIRGVVREREQAREIYREARAAGHVASLLTQERPNIFTQSVANIEPGRRIDVSIRYFHTLAYDDGWFEYVFPMVVGPRFNPSGSTGGVGATPRGDTGRSGQPTEVPYLAPGERSGHDISLAVRLDAGVRAGDIRCATHRTEIERESGSRAVVRLSPQDAIPNKDFVLRYRVAGEEPRSALITHRPPGGADGDGYFALMVIPPSDAAAAPRRPVEMIFVLDCSGSMSGEPLAQAKEAVRHALSLLTPRDAFRIIRFSDQSSAMGGTAVAATAENLRRARRYLDSLSGEGGTMVTEGIRAALAAPQDEDRLRYVTFLTDGYIGNEAEVLGEMRRLLGPARVFSFGVGSSPNRFLMDRMAKLGGGAAAYLGPGDDGADVMDRFFARASRPALTDVRVDWAGMQVRDVLPSPLGDRDEGRLPDLIAGRPLVITGRFRGEAPDRVAIEGRAGGSTARIEAAVSGDTAAGGGGAALGQLWARHKIADLTDRAIAGDAAAPGEEIRRVALAHGVLCGLTAFIAVDAASHTSGDYGVTVPVAVPVPEGVRYDTTVSSRPGGRGE